MSFIQCGGAVHFFELRPPRATAPHSAPAPTLVFVNALGTDYRIWDDVIRTLPSSLGVLRYDQRGHGLSELGERPYDVEGLSRDLAALLEQLRLERVVVCGLSLGGLVAQRLAIAREPRLVGLCLCGTAARVADRDFWQARMRLVAEGGLDAVASAVLPRWFGEPFRKRDPLAVRGYETLLRRMPVEGYLASLAALASADLRQQVQNINLPTLVVAGELDLATPPDRVRELALQIPGARFELLRDASHLMCVEEPRALGALLTSFLGETGIV
jgi:3-oxoadipate enol-lactonase